VNIFADGERDRHEVDCLWPDRRLVVELDSFAFHRTRRDHRKDAARTADLELAGWRVMRLAWDDVIVRARATVRRLRAVLRHRGGAVRG
jgi:very-short-patch-repair endonuclease